ncbi:RluA family pseudouridine synthase [Feifania hominis]|uniref:Pseudouridine synthase n=1 Tax=Feifania hominis TaxID=2763660 RepID=A0A926HV00_9FIRM|nr:RluA family pseudouridine synthase [Feifania hominis]MBC8536823.1 RluA family pseudouridine synthase [Feifania hominis]
MRHEIAAAAADEGERADRFLAGRIEELTRSAAAKLLEEGKVTTNGNIISKNYKIRPGDVLAVEIPEPELLAVTPQEIPLDIVYEDAELLVVNKPRGMVVHPAAGNYSGTLVNALMAHCRDSLSGINGVIRPGIVHRIDKDTSGLLIVAKTNAAHLSLAAQIKEHSFKREYEAVLIGSLRDDAGTVDRPIGRSERDRKKMAVTDKNSRPAVTHYEVIGRYPGYTHVRCRLETGRTHQIRVHMASIGHPVAGDEVYGPKRQGLPFAGQCLHARTIGFVHPASGEWMEFDSGLPEYFARFLTKLAQRGIK